MKINKDSLKARANNISARLGIPQNVVYNRFFYDAFLSRLAKSKYKNHFVLKGGLYLSSVFGVDTRSTMDVDFFLRKLSMERERIMDIIKEVACIDNDDNIVFEIFGSNPIRKEDQYGGFQILVLGRLDNVRCQFGIDVATGDPIVPSERNYKYKCLVSGEELSLKAYSLESVIAEKLETVLVRSISNSRCKDYYDLYILRKTQLSNIDVPTLIEAFNKTCQYRHFKISKGDALALIDEIGDNQQIEMRCNSYCRNAMYAAHLSFKDVLISIREWIEIIL